MFGPGRTKGSELGTWGWPRAMTIASYCSELLLFSALRKMREHDAETEPRLKG